MNYNKHIVYLVFVVLIISVTTAFAKVNNNSFTLNLTQSQSTSANPFKPGDGLFVNTFPDSNSFLNRVFPIDDRGYAEFPIVGKVSVSGMSEKQVVDFIKQTFKNYLRYPNVYVKPMVRISMLGGFQRPGLYYVDLNNSLWDAVYKTGGPLLEDGVYEMHWQRNEDDRTSDIAKLFESGISLRAMGFKSGDQVWTPSPNSRTIWDTIADVMPVLTFATSVFIMYNTFRSQTLLLQR
jgi:protein involved in polysaccharide export with SLBB domain